MTHLLLGNIIAILQLQYLFRAKYYFTILILVMLCRLWDHLGSNIGLYVQQKEPDTGGGTKTKPASAEQAAKSDLHHLDSDADKVKSNKSRSRRREWKGLVTVEHPTLHSSLAESTPMEEEALQKVGHSKRSLSPQPELQRKRSRPEERPKKVSEISVHCIVLRIERVLLN